MEAMEKRDDEKEPGTYPEANEGCGNEAFVEFGIGCAVMKQVAIVIPRPTLLLFPFSPFFSAEASFRFILTLYASL